MLLKITPLLLILSLSGCAVWDLINPFDNGGGLSVDTELVVGDKQEEINTEVVGKKESTTNTADSMINTYNVVNKEYPFWVIALLILGWTLPSPSQMWNTLWRKKNGH